MDSLRAIENYLAAEMERKLIPGLSLAVVSHGQPIIKKHYGLANVELAAPVTDDTLYEIASITKSFTAMAIMLLVEDGQVRLDDPLARYLPAQPAAWAPITIHHLLTHMSGVENWTLDWGRSDITPAVVADSMFAPPLLFSPGSQTYYTDINFNLLGMVIHQLTGAPYDVFVRDRILAPLGMAHTRHNDFRAIIPHRAYGYDREAGALVNSFRIIWNVNLSPEVPSNGANASLLSNLDDLLKWAAEWSRPTLLPAARLAQMMTPATRTDGTAGPLGIGCEIEDYAGHKLVAFGGGTLGFTTSVSRFVEDELTVIILTNQDSKPWDMAKVVAGLFEPALAR